jgi:hypothetical protein
MGQLNVALHKANGPACSSDGRENLRDLDEHRFPGFVRPRRRPRATQSGFVDYVFQLLGQILHCLVEFYESATLKLNIGSF